MHSSADCLFCKIVAGKIPVQRLAEDDAALAFPDINPQAPVHVLVVPKLHVESLDEIKDDQWPLVGRIHALAVRVARDKGLTKSGFRTLFNTGPQAGQTVWHLHLHMLGGRSMMWPPG